MERELYSIEQARALLGGIAHNTLYDLLRSERWRVCRSGGGGSFRRVRSRRSLPRAVPRTARTGR
jgi:hypothetical protein